jgi:hypothetical protein
MKLGSKKAGPLKKKAFPSLAAYLASMIYWMEFS